MCRLWMLVLCMSWTAGEQPRDGCIEDVEQHRADERHERAHATGACGTVAMLP